MNRFDRDTAVTQVGPGAYAAEIAPGWRAVGPNGGYVAAIVLRSLCDEVAATSPGERSPRSLVVHYLAPPHEGPIEIETTIDKFGRTVTFVSARATQEGRPTTLARAVFSEPRDGPEFFDLNPPDLVPFEESIARPDDMLGLPEISMQFDSRIGYGAMPFSQSGEAATGGWLKYVEDRPLDHLMLAALSDAWWPAIFARAEAAVAVPTVDLNIHFRCAHPEAEVEPGEYCVAMFRSGTSTEGFIEEDGEIWSPGGKLLSQSRQLALSRFV